MLDDALWSSRPVKVDRDQTKTLIKKSQHYTMWERADILIISKTMKLLLKVKKNVFYFTENNQTNFLVKTAVKEL